MGLNKCMCRAHTTPKNWVCNASKIHKARDENSEEYSLCGCVSCLMLYDPNLVIGSPQPSESMTVEKLESNNIVGMYARKPEFYIPCDECHESIPISDPEHIAAIRSGTRKLYHWGCTPEKMEESMVSPYVLFSYAAEECKNEGCCESVCGENGEGTEGERLSGELEESEPRDDVGEDVG